MSSVTNDPPWCPYKVRDGRRGERGYLTPNELKTTLFNTCFDLRSQFEYSRWDTKLARERKESSGTGGGGDGVWPPGQLASV